MAINITDALMTIIGEADIEDILDEGGVVIVSAADVDGVLPSGVTVSGDTVENLFSERWGNAWRLASGTADLSVLTGDDIDISNADIGTVQIGLISTDGYTISDEVLHSIEVSEDNMALYDFNGGVDGQSISTVTPFTVTDGTINLSNNEAQATGAGAATYNNMAELSNVSPLNPIAAVVRFVSSAGSNADHNAFLTLHITGTGSNKSYIGFGMRSANDGEVRMYAFIAGEPAFQLGTSQTISGGYISGHNYKPTLTYANGTYTGVITDESDVVRATISEAYSNPAIDITSTRAGFRVSGVNPIIDDYEATLSNANQAPVITGDDQDAIIVSGEFTPNVSVTDNEDTPTILWANVSGVAVTFSDDSIAQPVISGLDIGETTTLRISADDGVNAIVTRDIIFTGVADTRTPVSMVLNGTKLNTTYVGQSFADLGVTITYDDASTSVQFADTPWSTATASRAAYEYSVAGLQSLFRRVNVEELLITPVSGTTQLAGLNSWWMHSQATKNGNVLTRSYVENDLATDLSLQGIAEFDATTREVSAYRYLQTARYPADEHNSVSHLITSTGRLIVMFTGHGEDRDNNDDGTFWVCESATGRIADLTLPIELDLNFTRSNYLQLFETANGDIWAFSNDDIGDTWTPLQRTGVNTWADRKPVLTLGTDWDISSQMYSDIAQVGNLLYMFSMSHARNTRNDIRLVALDVSNENVYDSPSNVVGNITTGDANSSAVVSLQNAPSIRQPAVGRSQRLIWVKPDGSAFIVAEFDTSDGANGKYIYVYCIDLSNRFIISNWPETDITTYENNSYLWATSYYPGGACIANDITDRIGIYTSRKGGSSWVLEFWQASANGQPFTGEVLRTATGNNEIIRPISPLNATSTCSVIDSEGEYGASYFTSQGDMRVTASPVNTETNTPPTSTDPADQNLAAGVLATVVWDFTDVDIGDVLSYNLVDVNNSGVLLNQSFANNRLTVTFTTPNNPTASAVTLDVTPIDQDGPGQTVRTVINVAAGSDVTKPVLAANPTQNTYNITQNSSFTPPVVTWSDNGESGIVSPSGAVNTAIVGTYILSYNYTDAAGNVADQLDITVNITPQPTDQDAQDAIAETDFEVVPTLYYTGFAGRSNVEIFKFKPLTFTKLISVDEFGHFDFENNNVQRVEVIGNGVTISSATSDVNFDAGELLVKVGALGTAEEVANDYIRFGLTIVLYIGSDVVEGVVIAGPNLPDASPVLTLN